MKGKGRGLGDEGRRWGLSGGREGGRGGQTPCSFVLIDPLLHNTAWPVYEQVFLAALDLGETLLAEVSEPHDWGALPFTH